MHKVECELAKALQESYKIQTAICALKKVAQQTLEVCEEQRKINQQLAVDRQKMQKSFEEMIKLIEDHETCLTKKPSKK